MSHFGVEVVDAPSPSHLLLQMVQHGRVSLNGHSCTKNLNLLPGTIALVACLVGVIALNILGYNYLSICFVIGGIASGYTLYQGYRMRLLKTLADSNQELKEGNHELKKRVRELQGNVSEFERIVEEQKELISRLEENVRELNEMRLAFEQDMKSHIESLEFLVSSLSCLQDSASKDHKSFGTNLERLSELLSKLSKVPEKASESVASFERLRNAQLLELQKTVGALQEIFSIINKWKDNEAVSRSIENLQKLQKQQFKLNKDLRELSFEIGQKEGTLKALKQEVEELRELETKFRSALGILKKEVEGVGDHVEGIHEAAEVLRQANKPLTTAAQKIMESKREGNVIALNLGETV